MVEFVVSELKICNETTEFMQIMRIQNILLKIVDKEMKREKKSTISRKELKSLVNLFILLHCKTKECFYYDDSPPHKRSTS